MDCLFCNVVPAEFLHVPTVLDQPSDLCGEYFKKHGRRRRRRAKRAAQQRPLVSDFEPPVIGFIDDEHKHTGEWRRRSTDDQ